MTALDEQVPIDGEDFFVALRKAMRPETALLAGDQLAEVIQAVKDLRRKGTFTVTVELKPDKSLPDVVVVTVRTKTSPPQPDPAPQLMWPVDGGRLAKSDPRQDVLPGMRAVDSGTDRHDRQEKAL